jgi:glycerate 2-kinase
VPDEAGRRAAERILDLAAAANSDDLMIALISGGASALLSLPAPGVTLEDRQEINRALLASGAPIGEINRVREALSAIKGGRLALAAQPARVVTYLISDVPGDDPATIGSGPTIPEVSDPEVALAILRAYAISVRPEVLAAIRANAVLRPAPPAEVHMLATPWMALAAAADTARSFGRTPLIFGNAIPRGYPRARRHRARGSIRPVTHGLSCGQTIAKVQPWFTQHSDRPGRT